MSGTISESDRKSMKLGLFAFGFIVVFGSIGYVLTTYWDTLPTPPRSHEIQLDGTPTKDIDRLSAVFIRADFDQLKSKEKIPISRVTFYASDADPDEVGRFYRQALSTPWYVASNQESKGRRVILYRKMLARNWKIIIIQKRLTRDASNNVTDGSGSIIGTADAAE